MRFHATLHTPPKAKPRPRATIPWTWVFAWIRKGKAGRTPTPHIHSDSKYTKWEDEIASDLAYHWSASEHSGSPVSEAASLLVVLFFPRPKAKTWKTRPNPRYPHTSRPDADNCGKAIKDALQKGGILSDDSIVFSFRVIKWVCSGDEEPRIEVALRWGDGCNLLG